MKVFDNRLNFPVGEKRIVGRQLEAPVQDWMVIENAWFWAGMFARAAVTTRVCQLQTDYQTIVAASRKNMLTPQFKSQMCKALLCLRRGEKLIGVRSSLVG